ncbi:hypothetical protein TRVL_09759 [Trypanosoma vivax]|uniref:Uncharacterized protein n=1 Tax=Trypanosoma vivax (strain Y486) TaxID=1055687 RepID=G0TV16_TRYVY|nr:hypothetical protein TRVL_09759 [Trypanosoma vivax]CCC48199.1 hypothetical protein TVY486_0504010 [Trypanosoma vivax Y486]
MSLAKGLFARKRRNAFFKRKPKAKNVAEKRTCGYTVVCAWSGLFVRSAVPLLEALGRVEIKGCAGSSEPNGDPFWGEWTRMGFLWSRMAHAVGRNVAFNMN